MEGITSDNTYTIVGVYNGYGVGPTQVAGSTRGVYVSVNKGHPILVVGRLVIFPAFSYVELEAA